VESLLTWARRWFPDSRVVARWSAQDYHPVDELPYVGPLLPRDSRALVATGFAKWGMTNAVAAAHVLAGYLTEGLPEWGDAYRSWRRREMTGLAEAVRLNAGAAAQLTGGYARALTNPEPGGGPAEETEPDPTQATTDDTPAEGMGCVVRRGLHPVAVSTVDGVTRSVSAVCPHLGGVVRWNDEERSWDCPLHGSRFAPDGELLEGPATRGLQSR